MKHAKNCGINIFGYEGHNPLHTKYMVAGGRTRVIKIKTDVIYNRPFVDPFFSLQQQKC